jgi:hypothetical protein
MNSRSAYRATFARNCAERVWCQRDVYLRAWRVAAPIALLMLTTCAVHAQNAPADDACDPVVPQQDQPICGLAADTQPDSSTISDQQSPSTPPPAASNTGGAAPTEQQKGSAPGEQTNRIMGVMPNYRAVSADTILPPLSVRGKFVLATRDSLDYSSGLFAGLLSGYKYATRAYPEFGSEWRGYSRYLWRGFVDQAVGNYFTEAIVPSVLHEDPRYYTLGHGGVGHRTYYAITRLVVTKTDSGGSRFNSSEILGNGMAAGLSNLYYPSQERTLGKTAVNWGTQVGADGIANVIKEFWPDVRRKLFKPK